MTAGWVEAARTRLDAATPGPWEDNDGCVRPAGRAENHVVCWGVEDGPKDDDLRDAKFIAAAPTDLRRALDALDAVLALHAPSAEWRIDAGEGDEIELCDECDHAWPCPTARAIEEVSHQATVPPTVASCDICGGTGFESHARDASGAFVKGFPCPVCPTVRAIEGEQDA